MDSLLAACTALHAPPTGSESELRRAQAENFLTKFKQNSDALSDSITFLQNRQTPPIVQFHCVATIREVTLQRWSQLALSDKSQVLDFIMQLLLDRYAELPKFVAATALQTAVLLVKRGWLDRLESERVAVLQQLGAMLQPDKATTHRLLAAKWFLSFVNEFSSASRASNMMQPIEFHTRSRRMLEKSGELKDIVALAVSLLEDSIRSTTTACGVAGSTGNIPAEQIELLDTAFQLCGELLNWQHEDLREGNLTWSLSTTTDESDISNRPTLTPQASWRPIIVRPELIHSAFNTYAFFRTVAAKNETLLHLARQFLIQLASIQGPIFEDRKEQVQFLAEIFRGVTTVVHDPFFDLVAKNDSIGCQMATQELVDCCQILLRLANNIGLDALLQVSSGQLFPSFIEELASLTCKLLHSALERTKCHLHEHPNDTIGELWELEGVDILLDAWIALVNDPLLTDAVCPKLEAEQALAILRKASSPVVELYLQVQLELCAVEVLAEQDEDEDVEDNARSSAREQYELAAALARLNSSESASLLLMLVQSLIQSIQQELTAVHNHDEMTPKLSQLFEKLYFTIVFAGLFLADDYKGERPSIPNRIHTTFQNDTKAEDSPIINLIIVILNHVLEFETSRLARNPTNECVSPFLSEGLIESITRLCATYLIPDNLEHKGTRAPALIQTFGFENEGRGGKLLYFVVEKAVIYLLHWPTQPVVMEYIIEFFLVLSNTRAINSIVRSDLWQSLAQANGTAGTFLVGLSDNNSPLRAAVARIPTSLRGQLTEAVCRAGMTSTDSELRMTHFQAVSQPIAIRLQQLIKVPNVVPKQISNDVYVQEELKLLVEMYSGIARSAESTSHNLITSFCLPALPIFVQIFQVFQSDSQLVNCIFQFFCSMVETQLCFLPPCDAMQVYSASDKLIRAYRFHNLGKKSMQGDAEEESYVDLLALLTLLSHLAAKDVIDFSEESSTGVEQAEANCALSVVADVVFSGLCQVIPLMTEQLLAYPSLSKQYFTLVSYMVEVYAENLVLLPSDLFQMLLHSLLIGIRHVSLDVVRNSFQALGELACHHWRAKQSKKPGLNSHLQQHPDMFMIFLRVIFRMALFDNFNPVILDACAGTLYPLILIEQARYHTLAEEIGCQQENLDAGRRQRLTAAFAELTCFLTPADIALGAATTRKMRMQFKTNLYAFVAEVRGFLQVR
ncbi:putative importin-beta domain, exportin-1 [Plasmopara halstedii]